MAKCSVCNQEMLDKVSCRASRLRFTPFLRRHRRIGETCYDVKGQREYKRRASADDCGDCGAPTGGFHHPGCDRERCPRCGGQLISCACNDQGRFYDPIEPPARAKVSS